MTGPPPPPAPVIRSRDPSDPDRLFDEESLDHWILRSDEYSLLEELRPPAELEEAVARLHGQRRQRAHRTEPLERADFWEFLPWTQPGDRALEVETDGRTRDVPPLSQASDACRFEGPADRFVELNTHGPHLPARPWSEVGLWEPPASAETTEEAAANGAWALGAAAPPGDSPALSEAGELAAQTPPVDAAAAEDAAVVSTQEAGPGVDAAPPSASDSELAGLKERFEAAQEPAAVSEALLDYCAPRFGRGFILVEDEGTARIWRGFGPGSDDPELASASLPLADCAPLQEAARTAEPLRLPFGDDAADVALAERLGAQSPYRVLAAVRCGERPVGFVYAECPIAPLAADAASELRQVVELAGRAHARLSAAR